MSRSHTMASRQKAGSETKLDDLTLLRTKVFELAKSGKVLDLDAELKDLSPQMLSDVLNVPVKYNKSLETTPLIMAARQGHTKVVQLLLSQYGVDVEQTGMVEFSGHPLIKGASALWCAASIGNLDLVHLLVEDFHAEVNHATITNSTPLRPACFDGFLEVVEYLVQKGAEVNRPTNYYRNTCLLIAAYNGHLSVVRFLLQNGAKHDMCDFMGQTALHNAAEKGHIDIAMELINHGAKFTPDNKNLTPLHVACDFNHEEMVKKFLKLEEFTLLEKIEAWELLGASFANGSENYNIGRAYRYMQEGMVLRWQNSEAPLPKQPLPPEKAYNFQAESCTLQELEKIEGNDDKINTEALILKERVLGRYSVHIMDIVYRGAVLADRRDYDGCILLWDRALDIRSYHSESLSNDLERYAELYSEILEEGMSVDALHVRQVLDHCVREVQKDQERLKTRTHDPEIARIHGNMMQVIQTAFLLVTVLDLVEETKDHAKTKRLVYRLVKLKPRLKLQEEASLLHIACDASVKVNEYFIKTLTIQPSATMVRILLECGADPNITDNLGNSPLHVLCKSLSELSAADRKSVIEAATSCCSELVQYGAHVDVRNRDGKTAIDLSRDMEAILKPEMNRRSLKCRAAFVVQKYRAYQEDDLPLPLLEFVQRH